MLTIHRFRPLLGAALLLAACSDDSSRPRREAGIGDGPRAADLPFGVKLSWTNKATLDTAEAGKHASLAVRGSKIGVAYFRGLKDNVIVRCPASGVSPAADKARPAQDLMFNENSGADWGAAVKVEQTYGETVGASLSYDASGKAFVGYLGGAINQNECSSGDAMIASAPDGKTFTKRTVLAAGPVGDTVGYWMAVAVDSKGADHAVFGDVRFSYYEVEGHQKASARYDGADVIAKENGAGIWNALVFDPTDSPVAIFFNPEQKGLAGGIQLALRKTGSWESYQLVPGSTKQKMGLALSPLGNLGVSYYEPSKQQLKYLESDRTDYKKTPWKEQTVDTSSFHAGEFSSLAFDSKGNPGVSYYKCGAYGTDTCDLGKDGLRFAWRKDGVNWSVYDVDDGGTYECGTYTSVGFTSDDLPVIAYRCVTFNSTTKQGQGTLKVARGAWQ